ncbi:MAG: CocE/NonD family hydrolase [Candidatus Anammoximicrobium sp.]|nr:CocE/NonD family hydrolase [Candidatus Anammoximicrobium sp.]
MTARTRRFVLILLACSLPDLAGAAEPIGKASPEQLRAWMKQYPQADANGDGLLSPEEAQAYHQKLQRDQAAARRAAPRFRQEYAFATMSDGVRIALAVGYPRGFESEDRQRRWPAVFQTCGYPGATVAANPGNLGDRFVTVQASIRGTGASGGALSPWRPRTWQDGYEIIENWIVQQPWSNGRVGILGYSWPGLLGFLTATTQPPSLKAVCVGGLIDDFYRGIARPGGVPNMGFPVEWMNNWYRSDGVFGSDAAARAARGLDDAAWSQIVAARPRRDWTQDMLWLGLHQPLDGPSWREQNLGTHAARIRSPILIGHAWQDEQTGPTGWQLWKRIADDVPKRLVLTNGGHGAGLLPADVTAWFRHWLLDESDDEIAAAPRRVACYLETPAQNREGRDALTSPLTAADFPLPQTRWTRYYLRADRQLARNAPAPDEPPGGYRVTHLSPDGGDPRATYELAFTEPAAVCGPAVLTLWAKLETLDTDFFVLLADRAPDGKVYGLQRGLLRASHRALDAQQASYAESDGQTTLIRPYHPHDQIAPVVPHEPQEYQIEIFAFGHVFRPGHRLLLSISQPPAGDPIGSTRSGTPSYRYDSHPPPGHVAILHDADHPSSLLLPLLPELPPSAAEPVPLDQQAGLREVR